MEKVDWDDLRLILWIGRTGSLSGAAEELGINVSTCSRRLNQIEEAWRTGCFIRRPNGMEMTRAGELIFAHAESMERQASSVRRMITARGDGEPATVSVTCPDSLAAAMVIPALRDWIDGQAGLTIDLLTDNRTVDLNRGDAHIALRLRRPLVGALRVRRIAVFRYGLFASDDYLKRAGTPANFGELQAHQLIGIRSDYPNHGPAVWWAEQCSHGVVVLRTDRTLDRFECAADGLGIAMLPLATGRRPGLTQVIPDAAIPELEVFLLADASTLRIPKVRKVADRLVAFARGQAVNYC